MLKKALSPRKSIRNTNAAKPAIYPAAVVMKGATIGLGSVVGSFSFVAKGAILGRGVRIQSHTSVWDGVTLDDHVFVGPGAMFTNVRKPRAEFPQAPHWDKTHIKRGATIGAHATIVAPCIVGTYAMIGAACTVTRDVDDFGVMVGSPARRIGYTCRCGELRESKRCENKCPCAASLPGVSSKASRGRVGRKPSPSSQRERKQ